MIMKIIIEVYGAYTIFISINFFVPCHIIIMAHHSYELMNYQGVKCIVLKYHLNIIHIYKNIIRVQY